MLNRLKGILYELTGLLACQGTRKSSTPTVLIIRTDEIGDFMLWQPFLSELIHYYTQQNYTIHFLGNHSWKRIFELTYPTQIKDTIWLDKFRFKKSLPYRYQLLKQVYQASYEVVVNPIYSRDKRNDDAIVKAANAITPIGMVANTESVKWYEKGYDKNLYTQLFNHPSKPLFEFYRNKLFTEFVTGQASAITNTYVNKSKLPAIDFSIPPNYFVVFPGSRNPQRIWPTQYFVEVSNYLFEQYRMTAVLCGAAGDIPYTSAFEKAYHNPMINLTGKTSLPQMLSVLSNAVCLLSVDTGSVHLAAAVQCTVFGIFNGSQYKRFSPYPVELNNRFFAAYPDEVENELADETLVKEKYEFVIDKAYSLVPPQKIIKLIQAHLYL